MLIRHHDLLSLRVTSTDGGTHALRDLLVEEAGPRARRAVVAPGARRAEGEVTLDLDRFGAPDVKAGVWPARIGPSDLKGGGGEAADAGRAEILPGGMVGQVGGVLAPDAPTEPEADAAGLRSVRDMLARTRVAASDGAAGGLIDLIFETDDWSVPYMIVETGGEGMAETQRVIPLGRAGRIDWEGGTIALEATREEIHQSPDLHQVDWLEAKWYNKVLAYYGLQS